MSSTTLTTLSTRWLIEQAKKQKKRLIAANLIAICATLISVPIPLFMPLMVDEVLLNKPAGGVAFFNYILPESLQQPASYIVMVLLLVIVMRILSQALNIWQSRQFTLVSKSITCHIRQQLLDKLGRISMKEYEERGSGGISSHLVTDIETIDSFLGNSLSRFVVGVLTVIGTAAILLWLDWALGLFILLVNPLVIYLSRKMGQRVKHLKKAENQSFERFQQRLVETLDGIYQLRAANRERAYLEMLKKDADAIRHDADKYAWQSEAAGRISFLMFLIGFELFRAAAMLMVLFSDLTIGQIFAVFGYLWFMLSPIQELLGIQYAWFSASAAMKRLNGLLALEEEPRQDAGKDPLSDLDTFGVECRDLTFSYDSEKTVLNGLSLTIPQGKRVALVGASGGGKSTLIQLLLGLYRKSGGDVLVDGKPIEEIGYETLRQHTAVVLQQPMIFNDTLRENLTLGRTDFSDQQLWQSLEIAQLSDVVEKLDNGLESQLGRQGLKLSGGQRQRLAIARMVLTNPKLVILDEATSALDTATEAALHDALNNFLQGRTTLIVAHRLSAVKQADLIYVLEDGKVAQCGNHNELVKEEGVYQTLYGNLQVG
ncbi:ABC transporter ATP-binding protein [Grimontia hollisae]|uniref:ABC-type multidrug transport system ATPase and permease component n=1 Tax=Grimontia hollisae CIP 101886 TaxID=675812 RepID=D0I5I1_GRIHO|nr:ABC transporter ATP-binding protein [Grimontia hollisae]AMG29242.1 ABC transporter ATP-binding protein [Grimontia hollisae]EEY73145.1 ABC-type multidrug transport system ATPase and permease component [Grimontia hollisae CIP 101886]MDF2185131.1 ABC transporter ATP-binding protein [Grimontia hollisae]STO76606.1 Putative multidrug export ATP-binding/permease protein SAV1866 [Grimontia hollisae]